MQTRLRIVALGDSTTAGTPGYRSPIERPPRGDGDETSQYSYWLMKAHPEWEVLNRGVNAERTDQIAARFQRDVLDHAPRIVVIIGGVNDVYQGRGVAETTRNLAAMYERAAAAGIGVVGGSIIPFDTATPEQNRKMRDIDAWIRERAQQHPAFTFVDTRAAVAAPGHPDLLVSSPDRLHPSAQGYRLMAEAIAPAVERALTQLR